MSTKREDGNLPSFKFQKPQLLENILRSEPPTVRSNAGPRKLAPLAGGWQEANQVHNHTYTRTPDRSEQAMVYPTARTACPTKGGIADQGPKPWPWLEIIDGGE